MNLVDFFLTGGGRYEVPKEILSARLGASLVHELNEVSSSSCAKAAPNVALKIKIGITNLAPTLRKLF